MSFDPAQVRRAIRHLKASDPILGSVIGRVGPFCMKTERRRFVALSRAIIGQQISGKAARSIWNRLQQTLKPERITADSIARLSPEQMRAVGVSPQKASYLHDLAAKSNDGTVRLSRLGRRLDAEVVDELIQVKGIGIWTAQMFLMFSLCRMDVFAPDDLGLRSAIRDLYNLSELPDRQTSTDIAQSWRPYQTIASWYLWRSIELDPVE
jgi:DNA-3-methyladenine glycosylase II